MFREGFEREGVGGSPGAGAKRPRPGPASSTSPTPWLQSKSSPPATARRRHHASGPEMIAASAGECMAVWTTSCAVPTRRPRSQVVLVVSRRTSWPVLCFSCVILYASRSRRYPKYMSLYCFFASDGSSCHCTPSLDLAIEGCRQSLRFFKNCVHGERGAAECQHSRRSN